MRIVHISDIHVSSVYYVTEWGDNVIRQVNSLEPDILIVSGDLVFNGLSFEYDLATEYLSRFEVEKKLIVPGNHDAKNEGYKVFEKIFGTRCPCYEDGSFQILGLDSSEPDIDDGHIGREKYAYIREYFSGSDKIKILFLHHHLIPIPGTGRERNIPFDAGDVLKLCNSLDIDFVLSGHKHKPWICSISSSVAWAVVF